MAMDYVKDTQDAPFVLYILKPYDSTKYKFKNKFIMLPEHIVHEVQKLSQSFSISKRNWKKRKQEIGIFMGKVSKEEFFCIPRRDKRMFQNTFALPLYHCRDANISSTQHR